MRDCLYASGASSSASCVGGWEDDGIFSCCFRSFDRSFKRFLYSDFDRASPGNSGNSGILRFCYASAQIFRLRYPRRSVCKDLPSAISGCRSLSHLRQAPSQVSVRRPEVAGSSVRGLVTGSEVGRDGLAPRPARRFRTSFASSAASIAGLRICAAGCGSDAEGQGGQRERALEQPEKREKEVALSLAEPLAALAIALTLQRERESIAALPR